MLWNLSKTELNQRLHAHWWREGYVCTSAHASDQALREHERTAARWKAGKLSLLTP